MSNHDGIGGVMANTSRTVDCYVPRTKTELVNELSKEYPYRINFFRSLKWRVRNERKQLYAWYFTMRERQERRYDNTQYEFVF